MMSSQDVGGDLRDEFIFLLAAGTVLCALASAGLSPALRCIFDCPVLPL